MEEITKPSNPKDRETYRDGDGMQWGYTLKKSLAGKLIYVMNTPETGTIPLITYPQGSLLLKAELEVLIIHYDG